MEHPQFTAPWKKLPQLHSLLQHFAGISVLSMETEHRDQLNRVVPGNATHPDMHLSVMCRFPHQTLPGGTSSCPSYHNSHADDALLLKITSLLVLAWPFPCRSFSFHCPTFCNQHATSSLRLHMELLPSPPQSLQIAPFLPDL